ncbi:MAG: FAD-binding oxidoreductase [Melioribacteraceae bacterium]|nr:FAD-binding oxidoreductase [Melioribacteraceae bacterium]
MKNTLKLYLREKKQETDDTISLLLEDTSGQIKLFYAGQYITLLFNNESNLVYRYYSISTPPSLLPKLRVTIKISENDIETEKILESLKLNDEIEAFLPAGNFYIETSPNNGKNYILIGVGSGITPLLSIANQILEEEKKSKVYLLYGNRNQNNIIFYNEIENMISENKERLSITHFLSRPEGNFTGNKGRINKEFIKEFLTVFSPAELEKTDFYICGPTELVEKATEAINSLELKNKNLLKEYRTVSIKTVN